jgi:hypothetical protein
MPDTVGYCLPSDSGFEGTKLLGPLQSKPIPISITFARIGEQYPTDLIEPPLKHCVNIGFLRRHFVSSLSNIP